MIVYIFLLLFLLCLGFYFDMFSSNFGHESFSFTENDDFYVKESRVHGIGLFTKKFIPANTKLFQVTTPDQQVLPIGRKINHCPFHQSNSILLHDHGNIYFLFTIKDVEAHEELTSDYNHPNSPLFITRAKLEWTC